MNGEHIKTKQSAVKISKRSINLKKKNPMISPQMEWQVASQSSERESIPTTED